jgi:hypothetical protein
MFIRQFLQCAGLCAKIVFLTTISVLIH